MVKAKMTLLALLFLGSAFAAFADLSNLTDYGCEDSTGIWRCHIPAVINESQGKLSGSVACFSTIEGEFDQGCYGSLELQKTVTVKDCTYSVTTDKEFVYNPCEIVPLSSGSLFVAVIDPRELDLTKCENFVESDVYTTDCPMDGKEIVFSGLTTLGDEENQVIMVTAIEKPAGDWSSALLDNLVYIILIIVIVIIAYFVFAPHKMMLKEKKEAPKRAEKYVSKREDRYGRKL